MNNYEAESLKSIEVDEDGIGLFCTIESEMNKDKRYELRCTESATGVVVTSCTCKGFYYYKRCKHVGIVQAYWDRLYKPAPVKVEAPIKKVRKPRNGLVRKQRNGGLILVQAPKKTAVAKIIETAVAAEVPAPKKDMMSASLTTNKGFQLMK